MKNLKSLRESCGLSQQKLADKFNLSQQSIYKYENQLAEPDLKTLIELAKFFNTSVDYLIGNTENPQKQEQRIDSALTHHELEHITNYRRLSIRLQSILDLLIGEFVGSD